MNARTTKAMRKAVHEAEKQRIGPAVEAVARYTKNTEQRVSELELTTDKVVREVEGLQRWKSRNLWGRIKWLLAGS